MGSRHADNWREAIARQSPLNLKTVIPPAAPTRTRVAITGFAEWGLRECPFDDPTWEIWGLNSGWWYCRDSQDRFRADRWFELHQMLAQTPEEIEAIRACPVPIYLTDPPTPDIPNGVAFPVEDMDARFGQAPYACTFAYQMALAIMLGFDTIGLYGVELQMGTLRERTVERMSVAYWTGYARGLGITIETPSHSGVVAHPYRYGFDYQREKELIEIYQAETAAAGAMFFSKSMTKRFLDTYYKDFAEFRGPTR